MRQLLPGLLFAMLWASASVATKYGHTGGRSAGAGFGPVYNSRQPDAGLCLFFATWR